MGGPTGPKESHTRAFVDNSGNRSMLFCNGKKCKGRLWTKYHRNELLKSIWEMISRFLGITQNDNEKVTGSQIQKKYKLNFSQGMRLLDTNQRSNNASECAWNMLHDITSFIWLLKTYTTMKKVWNVFKGEKLCIPNNKFLA